jgi:putative ABC transport system substrate-binding protein
VIGFLAISSRDAYGYLLDAFGQGLSESGYVEGRNVAIEYRWADNQIARLPAPLHLAKAAKRGTAALKANARRLAANVRPIIDETMPAGVTKLTAPAS